MFFVRHLRRNDAGPKHPRDREDDRFPPAWNPPQSCFHSAQATNLSVDLTRDHAISVPFETSRTIFCYYNRSRTTYSKSGQWYGVNSIPYRVCAYVIFGPMDMDVKNLRLITTPRDLMLIEGLRSAIETTARVFRRNVSLLVSLYGSGEFAKMSRSVRRIARFAAHVIEWVEENGFGGIDIDWSGLGQAPCGREEDAMTLRILVENLREVARVTDFEPIITIRVLEEAVSPNISFYFALDRGCNGSSVDVFLPLVRKVKGWQGGKVCLTVSAASKIYMNNAGSLESSGWEPYSSVCHLQSHDVASCSQAVTKDEKGRTQLHFYNHPDQLSAKLRDINFLAGALCILYLDGDYDDWDKTCEMAVFPVLQAIAGV
ncbi:unnamed protein product [Ixodes pacificus]